MNRPRFFFGSFCEPHKLYVIAVSSNFYLLCLQRVSARKCLKAASVAVLRRIAMR